MKCQICCTLVTLADRIARAGEARAGLLSAYYVDVRRRRRGADVPCPWRLEVLDPTSAGCGAFAGSDIDAHLASLGPELATWLERIAGTARRLARCRPIAQRVARLTTMWLNRHGGFALKAY